MLGPINATLNNMELMANGDILGMGRKLIIIDGEFGEVGWVFRLRPDGEIVWERLIAYPNVTTAPYLEFTTRWKPPPEIFCWPECAT